MNPRIGKAKPDQELDILLEDIEGFNDDEFDEERGDSSIKSNGHGPEDSSLSSRNSADNHSTSSSSNRSKGCIVDNIVNSGTNTPEISLISRKNYKDNPNEVDESNSSVSSQSYEKKALGPALTRILPSNPFSKKTKGDYARCLNDEDDEDQIACNRYDHTDTSDKFTDEDYDKEQTTSPYTIVSMKSPLKKMKVGGAPNKQEGKTKKLLCALYFSPLLLLLGIGIGVGIAVFSSRREIRMIINVKPPPDDFEVSCSHKNIKTLKERKKCEDICKKAECCMGSGETSCFSEDVCMLYSNCVDIYSLQVSNEILSPSNALYELKIDDLCTVENFVSDNMEDCETVCAPGSCCFEKAAMKSCLKYNTVYCQKFKKCSILSSSSVPQGPISDICSIQNIVSKLGRANCQKACKKGDCCFEQSVRKNCRKENKSYCEIYESCSNMFPNSDLIKVSTINHDKNDNNHDNANTHPADILEISDNLKVDNSKKKQDSFDFIQEDTIQDALDAIAEMQKGVIDSADAIHDAVDSSVQNTIGSSDAMSGVIDSSDAKQNTIGSSDAMPDVMGSHSAMYDAKLDISIQETVKDFSNFNLNKNQIIDLMKHEQFSDYFISTDNSNLKQISKNDYSIDSSNIQSTDCSYNNLLKQDQIIYHKCLDACEVRFYVL